MRRAVSKIIPSKLSGSDGFGILHNHHDHANDYSIEDHHNLPNNHNNNSNNGHSFFSNSLSNLSNKIDFNSVEDFYIVLDNPHNSWLPGDEISGQIIFLTKKNIANIIITLSLIGYVKLNASSHSKLRPIKHNLFHHTIKIYGGDENLSNHEEFSNGLFKGEHRFPFIVKLPNKRIFTSIDFGRGSIVYLLRAAIGNHEVSTSYSPSQSSENNSISNSIPNSNSNSNPSSNANSPGNLINKTRHLKILSSPSHTSEKFITLINPIDISKLPIPKPKKLIIKDPRQTKKLSRTQLSTSTINTINTYSTFSSNTSDNPENDLNSNNESNNVNISTPPSDLKPESIRLSLEIPKRGYLRGELIPIKLNINHLKKLQDVNGIIITLVRVCRLDNGSNGLFESFRKDLQQSIIPLYVDPVTFKLEINSSVRVPADAFPTILGCPLVSFQYFIEVLVNLSGKSVSIDGNTDHLSNKQKKDDSSHLLESLQKSNGDLKNFELFNFNNNNLINQNERSDFINTDKFKRMKKFIQITTEIIIGTHKLESNVNSPLSEENNNLSRIGNQNVNGISPLSRRSSLFSGSTGSPNAFSQNGSSASPHMNDLTNNTAPPPPPHPSSSNQNNIPYINVIPESMAINNFESPPYFDQQPIPHYNEISNNPIAAPDALDSSNLIPLPNQPELSEKDRIKAHESSLLPSEPPLDLDDTSNDVALDHDTISPIDQNNDILESLPNSTDQNNEHNNTNDAYQFFSNNSINDDNELYHDAPNIASNVDNDQDSKLDFVPNYELANNDRLLISNSNSNSTGTNGH